MELPHAETGRSGGSPGRSCPLHYRHAPSDLARAADARCDVLYVVGGLYGNTVALDAILALFDAEPEPKRLVFNGDFHWFDVDPSRFAAIQRRVLQFDALRGNVETELAGAATDDDHGCGCGYPDWVDDDTVDRSNRILRSLRATARRFPDLQRQLGPLPMTRRVDVGDVRVGIVHGDAESLAGWGFAQEALRDASHRARVAGWFDAAQVDVFASSHTCLPVLLTLPVPGGRDAVLINNGAAGMPNFRGDPDGLLTRIAKTRCRSAARLRQHVTRSGVDIATVAVPIDRDRWFAEFVAQWPPGSDAHASYWPRIEGGPDYGEGALRIVVSPEPASMAR